MAAAARQPPCFVAVHVGAGWHSPAKEATYKQAMCEAVAAARAAFARGGAGLDAVAEALRVLEDCPITNAGYGSNLHIAGGVECDASAMAGDGAFGALGAIPGIPHPGAAAAVLAAETRRPLPLGLVRPMFLVGDAARRWAVSRGLEAAPDAATAPQILVSPEAHAAWQRYTEMLREAGGLPDAAAAETAAALTNAPQLQPPPAAEAGSHPPTAIVTHGKRPQPDAATNGAGSQQQRRRRRRGGATDDAAAQGHETHEEGSHSGSDTGAEEEQDGQQEALRPPRPQLADVCDTVGCVVICPDGTTAAGVSSGGVAMKLEGRVGEAAVHGCGCWADDPGGRAGRPGVALSVSGLGEAIIRATLARACAAELQARDVDGPSDVCCEQLERAMAQGPGGALVECGLLAVRVERTAAEPSATRAGDTSAAPEHSESSKTPFRVRAELAACSTAPSFGVAYQAPGMRAPEAAVLRLGGSGGVGGGPRAGRRELTTALEFCCSWEVVALWDPGASGG